MSEEQHKDFSEQDVQQRFDTISKAMVEPGLFAEAVEAYKELIREFPGSRWAANAYLAIAQCYHAMGQEEDELSALEDIITQFPDHVVAKRAQGAVRALRERRHGDPSTHSAGSGQAGSGPPRPVLSAAEGAESRGEGPAGADLHGAVRRLTRQVERMREAHRRRMWLGTISFVVLLVVIWVAVRGSARGSLGRLDERVATLESQVQELTAGVTPTPTSRGPKASAPAVTVLPVQPPAAPATKPRPKPAPATKPRPKPAPTKPALAAAKPPTPTPKPPRAAAKPAPPKPKPAPTVKPPTPVAAAKTYTVKEGDSLWSVARNELGDGRRVDEIARLNGLQEPFKIKVGQTLKLPARR